MIKRLLAIIIAGTMLSGCFMAPMALIGPAASGFTTASIVQSGVTTGVNFVVKESTGKSLSEHAFDAISSEVLTQTYMPKTVTFINNTGHLQQSPHLVRFFGHHHK